MNNIFQHMREGRSADEVLFGEKTPTEESSFTRLYDRDLPLPQGRKVTYRNPVNDSQIDYRVNRVLSNEGSCGIIYMMNTAETRVVVMKEFCPKADGTYRYTNRVVDDYDSTKTVKEMVDGKPEEKVYQNYQLLYESNNKDVIKVFQKFKEEPNRILRLLPDPNAEDVRQQLHKMNLAHPFTECFEWQGNHYYVMENVSGVSLYEYVRDKGASLTWVDICSLMKQLCNALGHLHKQCVHQDVSPFNMLVDENMHLTLIDFGLATSFNVGNTGSFHTNGTPVFTDTTSRGTEYGKLYKKDGTPKPILVIDIYSIGMIFLYLLNSSKYQKVTKEDLIKGIAEDRYNLRKKFERIPPVSSQDVLIQILQNRAANILASDSVSFEDSLNGQINSSQHPYGPFENRPKDTEEWMKRLNAINGIEAYVKGLVPTDINLSYDGLDVAGVPFESEDDEVVCIPHENTTDSSWVTVKEGKLHVTENNGNDERKMTVYVIKGAEVKGKYNVVQKVRQKLSFSLNTTSPVNLPANDEKAKVEVIFKTNGNWEASCKETWLKGFETQGKAGIHTFELTAEPNNSLEMRDTKIEWTVSVDGKTEKQELAFTQPGCGIKLPPNPQLTLPAKGTSLKFMFEAGSSHCTADITCSERTVWLENRGVSQLSDGTTYQLLLVSDDNETPYDRVAHVTLTCQGNQVSFDLLQSGKEQTVVPKVKFSQTGPVIFEASGGSCKLDVEATGPWTAYIENYPEWVQIIGKDKGSGNGTLTLKSSRNESSSERGRVKLVVKLDDGQDMYSIFLRQKGWVERTVDWRGWWLRTRPFVLIACILLAIGAGYGIWWSARPALVLNDAAYLEVAHDVSMAEWSFDTKGDWTAEVVDGTWLTLEQKSGHSGSNVLTALFRPNTKHSSHSARISLTCMDKSVTLELKQGYNRVDSLNHVLTELREEMDKWNKNGRTGNAPNYDELLNDMVKNAFHDRNGNPLYNNYRTIRGMVKDCRIGETHRVVDFKKNDQGKFSEIILEPIKKDK